jgi:hypothetical protein
MFLELVPCMSDGFDAAFLCMCACCMVRLLLDPTIVAVVVQACGTYRLNAAARRDAGRSQQTGSTERGKVRLKHVAVAHLPCKPTDIQVDKLASSCVQFDLQSTPQLLMGPPSHMFAMVVLCCRCPWHHP